LFVAVEKSPESEPAPITPQFVHPGTMVTDGCTPDSDAVTVVVPVRPTASVTVI